MLPPPVNTGGDIRQGLSTLGSALQPGPCHCHRRVLVTAEHRSRSCRSSTGRALLGDTGTPVSSPIAVTNQNEDTVPPGSHARHLETESRRRRQKVHP